MPKPNMIRQILPERCVFSDAEHRFSSDRNIVMHPDRKIGFAMGILLIGVVAALFFRNEPLLIDEVPAVRREKELNEQLRVRDVAVYLDAESDDSQISGSDKSRTPSWTLTELFRNLNEKNDGVPLPIGVGVKPEQTAIATPTLFSDDQKDEFVKAAQTLEPNRQSEVNVRPSITSSSPLPPLMNSAELSKTTDSVSAKDLENGSQHEFDDGQFSEYTVRYGDTLSHIAERFLGSQKRFQEIYDINRDRLSAPDQLKVGEAIRVPRL